MTGGLCHLGSKWRRGKAHQTDAGTLLSIAGTQLKDVGNRTIFTR